MTTSNTHRGDWLRPTRRGPAAMAAHVKRKRATTADWIPLEDRSMLWQFKLLLEIHNYVISAQRWVSSKEIRLRFNLGCYQTRRYMEIIEAAIPLEVERAKGVNEMRGTMLHYRAMKRK